MAVAERPLPQEPQRPMPPDVQARLGVLKTAQRYKDAESMYKEWRV